MSTKRYTAVIIGAGRIGCGFDSPRSRAVLTHAHAIRKERRLALVGIADTNEAVGSQEAKRWGTTSWRDAEAMLSGLQPNLVVIATPDDTHADMLLAVLKHRPSLIILEKPAVVRSEDAAHVRRAAEEAGVPVIVNFRRRFDDTIRSLADELRLGVYGSVLSASGRYSKGIIHTGSHLLDLARLLFGEMTGSQAFRQVVDWEGEPTVSGRATFERCPEFLLEAGDERAYSLFELDILTEKARLRLRDEGQVLEIERVVDDPLYKGFRILGRPHARKTELAHALQALMAHAVRVLEGREEPRSTLENALKTDAACRTFLN